MSKCIVKFCRSRYSIGKKSDICFFTLGEDPSIKELWLKAIGRQKDGLISSTSTICSIHFRPEDISTNEATQQKYVIPGAVPRLLLRPSELIKTPKMFRVPDHLKNVYNPKPSAQPVSQPYPKLATQNAESTHIEWIDKENIKEEIFAEPINYGPGNIIEIDDSSRSSTDSIEIKEEQLEDTISRNPEPFNLSDQELLNANNYDLTNQVQITFVPGNEDTPMEALLKKKIQEMAKVDVVKSRIIRQMTSNYWTHKHKIQKLRNEVARLRKSAKLIFVNNVS